MTRLHSQPITVVIGAAAPCFGGPNPRDIRQATVFVRTQRLLADFSWPKPHGANVTFSVRSGDQPRIVGPHIPWRIAVLRLHLQPIAGGAYDVDPGSASDLRNNARSR